MITSRKELFSLSRITVKVGTRVISPPEGGLKERVIEKLTREIAALWDEGRQIILVTSGAIGAGFPELGLKKRPKDLPLEQASSSIGQIKLIARYQFYFQKYGRKCAQILLSREDIENRERFLNARNTFISLLKMGIVPVVNENDAVTTEEIRYGDNDLLAGMVTTLVNAELLIILTDVKGLYPRMDMGKENLVPLKEISRITSEIEKMVSKEKKGAGGMDSKLKVASILGKAGVPVLIADGREENILTRLLSGEETGTLFLPASERYSGKKIWIGYLRKVKGWIKVDKGAETAIKEKGKSLLPSGIIESGRTFHPGDTVSLLNEEGEEIARGLVNYSSEVLEKITGKKTSEVKKILGCLPYEEIIHRDNLLIFEKGGKKEK
ncbi:glutamate 5-kinase [Candidatus Calescamantes bacterium]|nr:glutamate 5-kinase [Candidatus Calescamantes bacterium]